MTRPRLAGFLLVRGLLLVALEVTVVTFAWIPDPSRSLVLLQVIWAIGWSMTLTAPLVIVPKPALLVLGAALALSPSAVSVVYFETWLEPAWLRSILVDASQNVALPDGSTLFVSYPISPWLGVMLVGLALSGWFAANDRAWVRRCVLVGAAPSVGFVLLSAAGLDGDPVLWRVQNDASRSVMAFLNVEKYPPSPAYLLMTLGPTFLLLAFFGVREASSVTKLLTPLGRVPLFLYVFHLYVLRAADLACAALVWGVGRLGPHPLHSTPEWPLLAVWVIWAIAMAPLLPPARWLADLKRRRRSWFLKLL